MPILVLSVLVAGGCGGGSDTSSFSGNNANQALTISGSPASAVLIGDDYSFIPSANGSNGNVLSFSIRNQPRWSTFDSATGRVSGQTLPGDEGVYEKIQIAVSNGSTNASLPDFSITVTDTAFGSMTLSWLAPTQNSDGTPLTDLAGYNIYFGLSQDDYSNKVHIDNPSISTYMVENLLPNTYYVVATSLNSLDVESTYSNVAVKAVTSE
jgi:hypothetical protein